MASDETVRRAVWQRFTDAYFLRHTPEEIAWHTRMLAERDADDATSLVSGAAAVRARRHRHLDLHAADAAQLRAHDRPARSARPQHRRCAHHADRGWLQPRRLSRARRHRRGDHRSRRASATSSSNSHTRSRKPDDADRDRHAPRAAPGAHVHDADADHVQRRSGESAHDRRADRRRPPGSAVAGRQSVHGRSASTSTRPRS